MTAPSFNRVAAGLVLGAAALAASAGEEKPAFSAGDGLTVTPQGALVVSTQTNPIVKTGVCQKFQELAKEEGEIQKDILAAPSLQTVVKACEQAGYSIRMQ